MSIRTRYVYKFVCNNIAHIPESVAFECSCKTTSFSIEPFRNTQISVRLVDSLNIYNSASNPTVTAAGIINSINIINQKVMWKKIVLSFFMQIMSCSLLSFSMITI